MTPTDKLIQAIRKRPGMYVGSVHDSSGLLQLIWEIVANSLDQHLAGCCSRVDVTLSDAGEVVVADDGPGIPLRDERGRPFAETALTRVHKPPTFDGHGSDENVGMFLPRLGLFPVNVLSERLTLEVLRDGVHYRQEFGRGRSLGALEVIGATNQTGTTITLIPDRTIFGDSWINAGSIALRLRELAYLLPGLRLTLNDRRAQVFHQPRGLVALIEHKRRGDTPISPTLVLNEAVDDIRVEVALEWLPIGVSYVESYANIAETTGGGTHVDGLLDGLVRTFKALVPGARSKPRKQILDLVKQGLNAVICVRLDDPTYDAPTRDRLTTPEVEKAVSQVVRRALPPLLEGQQALVQRLMNA